VIIVLIIRQVRNVNDKGKALPLAFGPWGWWGLEPNCGWGVEKNAAKSPASLKKKDFWVSLWEPPFTGESHSPDIKGRVGGR